MEERGRVKKRRIRRFQLVCLFNARDSLSPFMRAKSYSQTYAEDHIRHGTWYLFICYLKTDSMGSEFFFIVLNEQIDAIQSSPYVSHNCHHHRENSSSHWSLDPTLCFYSEKKRKSKIIVIFRWDTGFNIQSTQASRVESVILSHWVSRQTDLVARENLNCFNIV